MFYKICSVFPILPNLDVIHDVIVVPQYLSGFDRDCSFKVPYQDQL
jgi:hypothetical protein